MQKEEAERLMGQTEQQVSILKASLDRATRAKEHAEAQVSPTGSVRGLCANHTVEAGATCWAVASEC